MCKSCKEKKNSLSKKKFSQICGCLYVPVILGNVESRVTLQYLSKYS